MIKNLKWSPCYDHLSNVPLVIVIQLVLLNEKTIQSDLSASAEMLTIIIIALVVLFYFYCLRPFDYWKRQGVPQHNRWENLRDVILGAIPDKPIAERLQQIYDDFPGKRYCGVYQFRKPVLFLRDYDLIKQLSVKDFEHFVDHSQVVPENSEPIWEKNLFSLKGDKWKDMRATLSPSFTSSKMKMMFGLISDYARKFVEHFEEQSGTITLEMKDTFTRVTNDVIATAAFGINCDSIRNPKNDFYLMGKRLTSFGDLVKKIELVVLAMFPQIAQKLGLKFMNEKSIAYFTRIVKENVDLREKHGVVRPDMLHLLMEARKVNKLQLTDDDITAQALIFFFAGFDSVSTVLCFMAHELAANTDVQKRLQQEVDETLAQCDGSITYEALSRMKYMDMVLSETLRKWPPGLFFDRVCVKPYTIEPARDWEKPLQLAKGDIVWISPFALHRDETVFPNPDKFDPERFSEYNPHSYIPFGVGPRSCIANRFALMEIKLVFLHLLGKFNVTAVDKTVIPLKMAKSGFQLTSHDGFWLGLKPRNIN